MMIDQLKILSFCHFCPFEVSEQRDHGVDGKEQCGRVEPFPEVEPAGDKVDQKPYPPLFRMFLCQHPHAHNAQGGGEAVTPGYRAVGVAGEEQVNDAEEQRRD